MSEAGLCSMSFCCRLWDLIKRIAALDVGLENCHSSAASALWSGDLTQYYVLTLASAIGLVCPGRSYLPLSELQSPKT